MKANNISEFRKKVRWYLFEEYFIESLHKVIPYDKTWQEIQTLIETGYDDNLHFTTVCKEIIEILNYKSN